jgi:hypothetical protein
VAEVLVVLVRIVYHFCVAEIDGLTAYILNVALVKAVVDKHEYVAEVPDKRDEGWVITRTERSITAVNKSAVRRT